MGLRCIFIIIDSRQWGGGIIGGREGGKEFARCPVVENFMGNLCAHASMDCRTLLSVGTGREDDRRENPGTDNQWERASPIMRCRKV